jgi:glutaredoxin
VRVVTLCTREGCCLCEEALHAIEQARAREPFRLEVVDIDADPELRLLYTDEAPVIAIDGKKAFKYRVTAEELLKRMRARV